MNMTVKIQSRGVLTLPKKMRSRVGIADGDLVDVIEKDGTLIVKPVARLDPQLQAMLKKVREEVKSGDYIEFSSTKEFHQKRKKKWGRT